MNRNQDHPEIKEIKNICAISPDAKESKEICSKINKEKSTHNHSQTKKKIK